MKEKEANKGQMVKVFNFNQSYVPPTYKYNKNLNLVEWGTKNAYPNYILNVYNNAGSSAHKSIVNKKVKLSTGNGLKDVASEKLAAFIKANKLDKQFKRASLDYELFNGFAFEVIWSNSGEEITSVKHIPIHKLRIGIENEEIDFPHLWFSNDWTQYRKEAYAPEFIKRFDENEPGGKQIYLYSEYNPSTDGLYPIIGYSTSMNWIELDYEISKFHLNQVKQGYSPSFLLNFATGIPTEEEQDAFFKEFKRNFSGAENAGKIIITYSEGTEQSPEFTKVDLNDSDKRFTLLKDQVKEEIVLGAEIPPQLVILTPGKLGSSDERLELMIEFQDSYIGPRQNQMEEVMNEILSTGGFEEEVVLKNYIEERAEKTNEAAEEVVEEVVPEVTNEEIEA